VLVPGERLIPNLTLCLERRLEQYIHPHNPRISMSQLIYKFEGDRK
jgi:hypothetical protein